MLVESIVVGSSERKYWSSSGVIVDDVEGAS